MDRSYNIFFLIISLSSLLCFSNASSNTISASSCSKQDVEAAISSATAGDSVMIPAGNCTWDGAITLNKAITIQGAGVGNTIITNYGFTIPSGTHNWRITGIEWKSSSYGGCCGDSGVVTIGSAESSDNYNWRVDHCKFTEYVHSIQAEGDAIGVVDHCDFRGNSWTAVRLYKGPDSENWSQDTSLGTGDAFFVEDCNFYTDGRSDTNHVWIANGAGLRVVFRHNRVEETNNGSVPDPLDVHGCCISNTDRGSRTFEIYENTLVKTATNQCCRGMQLRGGTGVVFNNVFNYSSGRKWEQASIMLMDYRLKGISGNDRCACTGTSPSGATYNTNTFCQPEQGGEGYPCCDQIGRGKNQELDPVYVWGNKDHLGNPINATVDSDAAGYIVKNRDYYDSVKPGYSPYTYPHPLVTGTPNTKPNAPTNLQITQ